MGRPTSLLPPSWTPPPSSSGRSRAEPRHPGSPAVGPRRWNGLHTRGSDDTVRREVPLICALLGAAAAAEAPDPPATFGSDGMSADGVSVRLAAWGREGAMMAAE